MVLLLVYMLRFQLRQHKNIYIFLYILLICFCLYIETFVINLFSLLIMKNIRQYITYLYNMINFKSKMLSYLLVFHILQFFGFYPIFNWY